MNSKHRIRFLFIFCSAKKRSCPCETWTHDLDLIYQQACNIYPKKKERSRLCDGRTHDPHTTLYHTETAPVPWGPRGNKLVRTIIMWGSLRLASHLYRPNHRLAVCETPANCMPGTRTYESNLSAWMIAYCASIGFHSILFMPWRSRYVDIDQSAGSSHSKMIYEIHLYLYCVHAQIPYPWVHEGTKYWITVCI